MMQIVRDILARFRKPKIRGLTVTVGEYTVRSQFNPDGSTERWITKQVSYHRAEKGEQLPYLGDLDSLQTVGNGVLTHRLRDHLRDWP